MPKKGGGRHCIPLPLRQGGGGQGCRELGSRTCRPFPSTFSTRLIAKSIPIDANIPRKPRYWADPPLTKPSPTRCRSGSFFLVRSHPLDKSVEFDFLQSEYLFYHFFSAETQASTCQCQGPVLPRVAPNLT